MKKTQIALQLPREVIELLDKMASNDSRSRNSMVEYIIKFYAEIKKISP